MLTRIASANRLLLLSHCCYPIKNLRLLLIRLGNKNMTARAYHIHLQPCWINYASAASLLALLKKIEGCSQPKMKRCLIKKEKCFNL